MSNAADIREDAYVHVTGLDGSINATDKVYRNVASGRFIKVRVQRRANPPGVGFGVLIYEVSGAHCGEDGKAKAHGEEGFQIAPAQTLTVQSDQPVDLEVSLELMRRKVAVATERAVFIEEAEAARAAANHPT